VCDRQVRFGVTIDQKYRMHKILFISQTVTNIATMQNSEVTVDKLDVGLTQSATYPSQTKTEHISTSTGTEINAAVQQTWQDSNNIKMDLQEVGGSREDWRKLGQDRDGWRALVVTVKNLLVP
jgi:hypothetical protein